jgi:hypothetical protein
VAGDGFTMRIYEGSNQLQDCPMEFPAANLGLTFHTSVVVSPSAGTHTYNVTFQRFSGSGTGLVGGTTAYNAAWLLIEDITGSQAPVLPQSVPVGILGQARVTVNSAAAANLNNYMSVTVNVPAGRTLRVKFETYIQNNTVNTLAGARVGIYQDATGTTGIGGTGQIQQSDLRLTAANVPEKFTCEVLVSPSAGSHTFSVNMDNGGGGSITSVAGGGYPTILQVEDVSPTPAPAGGTPASTLAYVANVAQPVTTSVIASTTWTATVTVAAGRTLRVSCKSHMSSSVAGDRIIMQLRDETSAVLNAVYMHADTANSGDDMYFSTIVTPSAGTHTYTIWYGRDAGTGTISPFNNSGIDTNYFLIEDISPASVQPIPTPNGVTPDTTTTRPTSPWVGMVVYDTDTGIAMVWTGSEWRRLQPAAVAWSRFSMGPTNTSSGTLADVPGWTDLSFTKRSASTQLYVTLNASAYASVGGISVDFYIRINAVDVAVAHYFFNAANDHRSFTAAIAGWSGLAAGNYTARLRWLVNGTGTISIDGNDLFSLRIEEILGM